MFFLIPTKVYQESECVQKHWQELCSYGKKCLIVTGAASAAKNGSLADVQQALSRGGVCYEVYSRIEENPSLDTVMDARDMAVRMNADFIVGIGGGSAMDAAKAIALMTKNAEKGVELLYAKGQTWEALPVIAVPTTCGTGSEVTGVSVLTNRQTMKKGSIPHSIFPVLALADPKYLMYAPAHIINATAVDALAHLVESYLNSNATDYSRMLSETGLKSWKKCKEVLTGSKVPAYEDYNAMLYTSTLAGMAIAHTKTSVPHALSYTLTCKLGIPHGIACGYFLPGYIFCAEAETREWILQTIGFHSAMELKDFIERACGSVKVPETVLQETADEFLQNPGKRRLCPYPLDETVMVRITHFGQDI